MPAQADPKDDIIHLAVCVERVSSCRQTLVDVQASLGHPLSGAAFRYAIVEYATPFNTSEDAQRKRRKVSTSFVPSQYQVMHGRLISARNQLLAHADMSVLDGSLNFTDMRGLPLTTTTLNHIDVLDELKNINEFIDLVQGVVDNLFAERLRLLVAFPHLGLKKE